MATNKILDSIGAVKSVLSTGGDSTITFGSVANGAGRSASRLDFGARPLAKEWRWYGEVTLQATPTIGKSVGVFLIPWDDETSGSPARPWGGQSISTDAAFATAANLRGLYKIGDIIVHAASAGAISGGGRFWLPSRYCTPVLWNDTGAAANATSSLSFLYFTPIIPDVQAAA